MDAKVSSENRSFGVSRRSAGVPLRGNRFAKGKKRDLKFRDLVVPALEAKLLRRNETSSIRTDRVRLRRVLPAIGHLKVCRVTTGRVERLLEDLARGDNAHRPLTGATVNRFHSLLSSIFRYAVRQGLADSNPLAGGSVPRSKESPIRPRFLDRGEQHRLLAVIRRDCPRKADEVELAILSGMRRGEQWSAQWMNWKVSEDILYVRGKTGFAADSHQSSRETLPRAAQKASAQGPGVHHAGTE